MLALQLFINENHYCKKLGNSINIWFSFVSAKSFKTDKVAHILLCLYQTALDKCSRS